MEDERAPLAQAIREAYRRGEEDETLAPLVLTSRGGTAGGKDRQGGCRDILQHPRGAGNRAYPLPD